MKVTLTYYDSDSLTKEEVIQQAKRNYGEHVQVSIMPTSSDPKDIIYFAIQQLITYEQLSALFDAPHLYDNQLITLRGRIRELLDLELESVIKDNEKRVS